MPTARARSSAARADSESPVRPSTLPTVPAGCPRRCAVERQVERQRGWSGPTRRLLEWQAAERDVETHARRGSKQECPLRRTSRASRTGVATSAPADRRLVPSVRDRPSRHRRHVADADRTPARLEEERHDARREVTVLVRNHDAEDAMDGLGVERRERIGRVAARTGANIADVCTMPLCRATITRLAEARAAAITSLSSRAPRRTEREVAETHPFIVGADGVQRYFTVMA